MAKRLFDILFGSIGLFISIPFILVAAIGIKVSSRGPVFYRAKRVGRQGAIFYMYKLRSMHVAADQASSITAPDDKRVFAFGNFIRRVKIDELPQFWNILSGDLSLVGPRAEAVNIVDQHYSDWMKETLQVRPGVTSPGAIYNYMMSECLLDEMKPEESYVSRMLPPKLALERAYMERATLVRDIGYIGLTILAILAVAFSCKVRLPIADVELAKKWAPNGPFA